MKRNPRVAAAKLIILGALLGGCAGGEPDRSSAPGEAAASPEGQPAPPVIGGWRLVAFGLPETGEQPLQEAEITLSLSADGSVAGTDGCNRYMGQYALEADRLSFGPLASTMKACPEPVMEQGTRYLQALEGTVHALVRGEQLELHGAESGPPLLSFVRAELPET